jgi:nucleoside-diphosphate-sugar epimerase
VNVLVTGCAGFIGSNVCRLLARQGINVLGVDNLNNAYDPKIKHWRIESLKPTVGFEWTNVDIRDKCALSALFRNHQFDAVINLAARAGVRQSTEDPWVYYETNVIGTLNLLEECRNAGIKRFVLASSSSVYASERMPFVETARADRPLSPYSASKKAAEELAYGYYHNYGISVVPLRFFTVYGPSGRPDMSIFRFIKWIAEGDQVLVYGDGSQKRDFTYVDDIAKGVVSALFADVGYEVINLGSDNPVELRYVIGLIEKQLGLKAQIDNQPPHPLDVHATWADISKARTLLGWEPCISIEKGIEQCVAWYVQNRTWARGVAT